MKLQKLLLTPQREVLVELCITKDNGEIETFNAYRSGSALSCLDVPKSVYNKA